MTERETETARQRKTDKGRKARQIVIEKLETDIFRHF